jgi:hypothetical protein
MLKKERDAWSSQISKRKKRKIMGHMKVPKY